MICDDFCEEEVEVLEVICDDICGNQSEVPDEGEVEVTEMIIMDDDHQSVISDDGEKAQASQRPQASNKSTQITRRTRQQIPRSARSWPQENSMSLENNVYGN